MINFAIKNPVTIIVSVLIVILFGFISLDKLPYQLTPSVTKPEIKVTTVWPGATPYEIEREIIEEQEKAIKSLNSLIEYESSSKDNLGEITLTFGLDTPLQKALLDVSNKLNEVNTYPTNVQKPVIKLASASPVIWCMLQTIEGNTLHIDNYKTYFEDELRASIERVEGVADLLTGGGRKKQMQIILDDTKLASYSFSISEIISILQKENVDISAGIKDIDRRSYRVRTTSKFKSIEDIENVIIYSNNQTRVRLKDIAKVEFGLEDPTFVAKFLGKDGIFFGVQPNANANIVALTNEVESVVNKLNKEVLEPKGLKIKWLYDQRPYIVGAVDLVKQNILLGGILAIFILILFLRAVSPTAVVAIAIPISVIGTFIILDIMGRSLNTISLAGISFAVGMLVDSAIVVLENIDRHRKLGKPIVEAAFTGTTEVWGALIASASTTIAVFLPIIFLEDEAGQLFKDIAIAVTASVSLSLFVSIAVIPMLWKKFASFSSKEIVTDTYLTRLGNKIVDFFMSIVKITLKNLMTKIITVVVLSVISLGTIYLLFPKMDYLPQGNKNLIFNILIPPPGLSYEERYEIGDYLMKTMEPYVNKNVDGLPAIGRLFYVSFGDFNIFGGTAVEDARAKELIPLFRPIINSLPGIFGVSLQSGVFEQGIGKGNIVNLDISGEKIEDIAAVGAKLFGASMGIFKGQAQVRPVPSIELLYNEIRIIPNREILKANNLDSSQFGIGIDVLMNGRNIGDYEEDGKKKLDLILKGDSNKFQTPEDILNAQIVLPDGKLAQIKSLAKSENLTGISEIRHLNGTRTISLQITPPLGMTISETMEILKNMLSTMQDKKEINDNVSVNLSGTADKLTLTIGLLAQNFILALIIIYLLMSALFGNFIYPLVIMFTVPLATAGGFVGLKLTNIFLAPQPLDILTMLGFIILIGIVVNSAILIVHQSLNLINNHGLSEYDAIIEATKTRIRPIYMSSLTSVFGMLPLVLIPGPGSEFYRGLGSVITGGLALSTFFTIFITPALLMLFIRLFGKKDNDK